MAPSQHAGTRTTSEPERVSRERISWKEGNECAPFAHFRPLSFRRFLLSYFSTYFRQAFAFVPLGDIGTNFV